MPQNRDRPPDPDFPSRLVSYHEALIRGELADETGGDSPLPVDQVERDARACLESLERWRRECSGQSPAGGAAPARDEPATGGTTLGRFEILKVLGRGGCAVVLLARDPQLDRPVALKVPRPELLVDLQLQRRFVREAETAAVLRHPNIVAIYEAGEIGPVAYIAEEYCEGGTLAAWLASRPAPVPPTLAAGLLIQLAMAVQFAHTRGVLHRDLKPSNVLIDRSAAAVRSGDSDPHTSTLTLKVIDFGLAKVLDAPGETTLAGTVVGTPAYMAPEQALGQHDRVGTHTDVYALGAILYELVTGKAPFDADTGIGALQQVVSELPQFPADLRKGIPRDLQAICLKCLEKRPEDRYHSADALADDLQRHLRGEATLARRLRPTVRMARWCRRRPSLAGLIAVSVASLACLLVGGWWYAARLDQALQGTERALGESFTARERAERERATSETMRRRAEELQQRLRLQLFASNLRLAHDALRAGDLSAARGLLTESTPLIDPRRALGFAHQYLLAQCALEDVVLSGHDGDVYEIAFSPDGTHAASAGKDGTLRVWDSVTGKMQNKLEGHSSEVNAVVYSPDGAFLASASDDSSVRLWNAASGEEVRTFTGHRGYVFCVQFTPDGESLVSAGDDGEVRVWKASTGELTAVWKVSEDPIDCLCVSADGALVATADGLRARVWRLGDQVRVDRLPDYPSSIRDLVFAEGGKTICSVGNNSLLCISEWETGEMRVVDRGYIVPLRTVAVCERKGLIASGGEDRCVRIWDMRTGQCLALIPAHTLGVWCVTFSGDGRLLASASCDGTIKIWNVDRILQENHWIDVPTSAPIEVVTFGGRKTGFLGLALQNSFGCFRLDPRGPERYELISGEGVLKVAAEGSLIAMLHADGKAIIWDCESDRVLRELDLGIREPTCIALSRDKSRLAVNEYEKPTAVARVWDVANGRVVGDVAHEGGAVRSFALSSDGRFLAAVESWRGITVHDVASGQIVARIRETAMDVRNMAWSPKGSTLLVAYDDLVSEWEVGSESCRRRWSGQLEHATAAAHCPDGIGVAAGGRNGLLKIWDRQTGRELLTLDSGLKDLRCVAWSDDGLQLVAAGAGANGRGAFRLWSARRPPVGPLAQ